MTNQEQLQTELRQTREQLEQAQSEIAKLKERLADIDKLEQKINEYERKREEYESTVEEQAIQRGERSSSQFGWGQAVNFVPIFSHAYSYGASKLNETVEAEQKQHRDLMSRAIDEKYKEVRELCKNIKGNDSYEQ